MLAGKPGMGHRHVVSRLSAGKQNFGLGTLLPIAANLDTSIADLLAGIA